MPEENQPATFEPDCIQTATEREAMDWSLVLLSQGIESILHRDNDTGKWQLAVPTEQLNAANSVIQLYEQENRAWPFRRALPWAGFSFDWSVLAWVGMIAVLFGLQSQSGSVVETSGISTAGLVRDGQWWRTITATTLHADLGHLATNAAFGTLLLGIAMGRYGSGIALLTTTLGGAIANMLTALWRDDLSSGLGASGVVMAALGLLTADSVVQQWRRRHPRRLMVGGLAGGLLLCALLGFSPTSDVPAHVMGFTMGLLFGLPLAVMPLTTIRQDRWNFLAGLLFCGLMAGSWWLALSSS